MDSRAYHRFTSTLEMISSKLTRVEKTAAKTAELLQDSRRKTLDKLRAEDTFQSNEKIQAIYNKKFDPRVYVRTIVRDAADHMKRDFETDIIPVPMVCKCAVFEIIKHEYPSITLKLCDLNGPEMKKCGSHYHHMKGKAFIGYKVNMEYLEEQRRVMISNKKKRRENMHISGINHKKQKVVKIAEK